MAQEYDVLVIGGGPGGYVAAIRAAQLGFKTACCESASYADPDGQPRLGGTCLNVGCIPSKALLHTTQVYEEAIHSFPQQGINIGKPKIDVAKMHERKDGIVDQLTGGVKGLFKKNKVTFIEGHGAFEKRDGDYWQMKVGDNETVRAHHIVIATGASPRHLSELPVDNKVVCDNVGALDFNNVPKRLAVVGGGVIGLEMGSVWRRLGSEVTVIEAQPEFLSGFDIDVAKEARRIFTKQGLDIKLGCQITDFKATKRDATVFYNDKNGSEQKLAADRVIVSIGRVPNTEGLNGDAVGLELTGRGFVDVDDHCRTNLPNVWAVGDVVRGPMLAHKAMEEGMMVGELIAGQKTSVDFNTIPWVIYTSPEIASVGLAEFELRERGIDFHVGKIPFQYNGRALGNCTPEGFVKILADQRTDRVLGVHIIGANAAELISEAVTAMEFGAAAEDIARICHAHPTMSEVMREAALAVDKRSLHF